LVGIILPLAVISRPVDWKLFFYIAAMGFTSVWVVYSIILLGYVFLVEGRRNTNKLKMKKEEDFFSLHSTKKWKDLRKITLEGNKDQEMSNTNWN
jgi:hypothetical protein